MGTIVSVSLPDADAKLAGELNTFIKMLSDTVWNDSKKISTTSGAVQINEFTYRLLEKAPQYERLSNGSFNIAIGTLTSLYGFPEGPFRTPATSEIKLALELIKTRKVELHVANESFFANGNGLNVDLGGFAKGSIVDEGVRFLRDKGLKNFIINAGGDLYAAGMKSENTAWSTAIASPDKKKEYIAKLMLSNRALATSGSYERNFTDTSGNDVSHIFDAKLGAIEGSYKSVSVVADTAELADALATIYYLSPLERIETLCVQNDTPVLIVDKDSAEYRLCGWER